ncbi:ABC transporter permease subunit [Helcococcus ovis]|nr:ABC transporter permease subunit [Helcococcus ovis]
MKKTLINILVAFIIFINGSNVFAQETNKDTLTVATNATFPPYEFIKDGKIVGIDMEIANKIAEKLNLKLNIVDMEFNTIISSIESGKAHIGMAGMTITKERLKSINFSVPYAKSTQIVLLNSNSRLEKIEDLKDKKIGTQLGTTGDIYAKDDFGEKNVQSFDKISDAILAMKNGKIDAIMIDQQTGRNYLSNDSALKKIEAPYVEEEYAIAINKSNKYLLDKVNKAIKELQDDGIIDKITKKYINSESNKAEILPFVEKVKNVLFEDGMWKYLAEGLKITLIVTFFSLILGITLGLLISVIKLYYTELNPKFDSVKGIILIVLNRVVSIFVSIIRGTPTMIQLLIMFNIILSSVKNLEVVAVLTFGINSSAYVSEIFRGAFKSVKKGEIEAARALGMNFSQTFRKIILPQSLIISLPVLGNECITLLKETSIAGAIGLLELTRGANIIISNKFTAYIPYFTTALIYYILVKVFEIGFKKLEGKFNYVRD